MHISTKKLLCVVFVSYLLVLPTKAIADLYEWQDEKGDIHVVDDILLVPPQYKDKAKVLKARPSDKVIPSQPAPLQEPATQEELYGNYPLEWWRANFNKRKEKITELEKTIEEQKTFMADYERGRRLY